MSFYSSVQEYTRVACTGPYAQRYHVCRSPVTGVDVAVSERVEEHIGRPDDDAVVAKDPVPKVMVFPLLWFLCARDEPNGDMNAFLDDSLLLLCQCDHWHKEP
jgi:hypothetical protein